VGSSATIAECQAEVTLTAVTASKVAAASTAVKPSIVKTLVISVIEPLVISIVEPLVVSIVESLVIPIVKTSSVSIVESLIISIVEPLVVSIVEASILEVAVATKAAVSAVGSICSSREKRAKNTSKEPVVDICFPRCLPLLPSVATGAGAPRGQEEPLLCVPLASLPSLASLATAC